MMTEQRTATPAPLPVGGQAPALLKAREVEKRSKISQFEGRFGRSRGRRTTALTDTEREQKRQRLKAQLSQMSKADHWGHEQANCECREEETLGHQAQPTQRDADSRDSGEHFNKSA